MLDDPEWQKIEEDLEKALVESLTKKSVSLTSGLSLCQPVFKIILESI
jgi:hypothetical protein